MRNPAIFPLVEYYMADHMVAIPDGPDEKGHTRMWVLSEDHVVTIDLRDVCSASKFFRSVDVSVRCGSRYRIVAEYADFVQDWSRAGK